MPCAAGCYRVNVTDKPLAYVVTRLDYIASSNDETGKVVVELRANAKGTLATATFSISAADNRVDDIDEAIVSRCIALIRYYPPDSEARRRIWQVMLEQFALQIDDALLDELVALFPRASGRDIKGLAKLAAKFCNHKQVKPSSDVFRRCSIFRGMELERPAQQPCST